MKELSIFVDESGDFGDYDYHAPYYRLFQVADLICTLKLVELKMNNHILSKSEIYFFGDERTLKKNYLKPLSNKEM